MSFFLLRRGLAALLLVFTVTSGALLLAQLAPGDYSTTAVGLSKEQMAAERHRLGLDRPFAEQYVGWLKRTLTLDLGQSFQYQRSVLGLVRTAASNTAVLAIAALVVATLIGIPSGIFTGSRRAGMAVRLLRGASLV